MTAPQRPTVENALHNLVPDARWSVVYGATDEEWELRWLDDERPEPQRKAIEKEVKRLQKEWDGVAYREQRRREYPSVQDQLDDLFHAGAFSPEMTAQIQGVKDRFPKPRRGLRQRRRES